MGEPNYNCKLIFCNIRITLDDDFLRLAAEGADHAGIVYTTQENAIGEIFSGLILIHWVLEAE